MCSRSTENNFISDMHLDEVDNREARHVAETNSEYECLLVFGTDIKIQTLRTSETIYVRHGCSRIRIDRR